MEEDHLRECLIALCGRFAPKPLEGRFHVASCAGLNEQYIYQIIAKRPMANGNLRSVGKVARAKLTKAFPDWLATKQDPVEAIKSPISTQDHPEFVRVPRVQFKLSAGVSGFVIEPENGNGKPVFFRKDWFDMHGYNPAKMFAVRVNGSSMEPSLWDGDLVVINTADTRLHDGDVYAINFEGELCIKRLRRDAGEWWATSDNADQRRFAPKRCTEDVKIIGRAVYKQSERL